MNQEQIIIDINKAFINSKFNVVVGDIPKDFIKDPRNRNKDTKYIAVEADGDTYLDWYYSEFNTERLMDDMDQIIINDDRDDDPELRVIAKIIRKCL